MSVLQLYKIYCDECDQVIIHGYWSRTKALDFMKHHSPESISVNGKQFCNKLCYDAYKKHKKLEVKK